MSANDTSRSIDDHAALRAVVESTSGETGKAFFATLVENLAHTLDTFGAWVTEYIEETRHLRALGFWFGGKQIEDYEYDVRGTPCEPVVDEDRTVHIEDRILDLYPRQPEDFRKPGVVSYLGVPLLDEQGSVIGHLAVVDVRPMPKDERMLALFRVFASRAAAELRRLRLETDLREREEKLSLLVGSAMDAIIELDENLDISLMNSAAEKVFDCAAGPMRGGSFANLLDESSRAKLRRFVDELESSGGAQHLWIPGGLTGRRSGGEEFPAEATLSRFELRRSPYYTLILRNVNDRLEAEHKIRSLTVEAEYLREEIKSDHDFDEIRGKSPALLRALRDVEQVAPTDSTVLILGETGTGKELFARAIHNASSRREKPLIKINCAAIPANLIESELFGHERGAFTGATQKREGRFALADGGSIFLDEIGELPLELQSKLLRVLQEGEFEPVGSSRTHAIDVRVLSATHRDLEEAVAGGQFREDLFYRLNVFPIRLPALRERPEDVPELAARFVEKLAARMGKSAPSLSTIDVARLQAYSWPGNVRELQNVIERALITSADGQLHLDRALPEDKSAGVAQPSQTSTKEPREILTLDDLKALEHENLLRALEATDWQIGGEHGAARLLAANASTLKSRIKAFGLRRPRG